MIELILILVGGYIALSVFVALCCAISPLIDVYKAIKDDKP